MCNLHKSPLLVSQPWYQRRETETCDEKIWVDMLEELEFLVFSEPSTPAKAALSPSLEESSLPLPGDHTQCSPKVDVL